MRLFVALSALDTPSTFLAVNTAGEQQRLSIGPITLPRTTRYLLMVADLSTDRAPDGRWAFQIFDAANGITQFLAFDNNSGAVILTTDPGGILADVSSGGISTPVPQSTAVICPSLALTCSQLFSCAEAVACLQAGNFSLDGDNDGFPCEGPPLNCGQGP